MLKTIGLVCCTALLILVAQPRSDIFSKYKTVEGYEIRPGIVMMPRYAGDGQVCEIGLEKRHHTAEVIDLDSALSRKVVDQIVDEFAPASDRGPKTNDSGGIYRISEDGSGMATKVEYQNVTVEIYSRALSHRMQQISADDNIGATIRWKNRECL